MEHPSRDADLEGNPHSLVWHDSLQDAAPHLPFQPWWHEWGYKWPVVRSYPWSSPFLKHGQGTLSHKCLSSGWRRDYQETAPVKWKWFQPFTRKQRDTYVWECLENGKAELTKLFSKVRGLSWGWLLTVAVVTTWTQGALTQTGHQEPMRVFLFLSSQVQKTCH